ncbi:hypothetical protein ACHAWF_001172 [Thalassiosira exigua]
MAHVMFVNGWPFLTTFSRRIRMITAQYNPSKMTKQSASCLTKDVYTRGGYTINVILMDQEFDKVEELIPQVKCNTSAAREHITDIENQHRTVKERACTVRSGLPFTYLPKELVINLVYFVCFWLNASSHPKGISANLSPREIVTCRPVSWKLHARTTHLSCRTWKVITIWMCSTPSKIVLSLVSTLVLYGTDKVQSRFGT